MKKKLYSCLYVVFFLLPVGWVCIAAVEAIYAAAKPFSVMPMPMRQYFTESMSHDLFLFNQMQVYPYYTFFFLNEVLGRGGNERIFLSGSGFRGITDEDLATNTKPLVFVSGGSSVFGSGSSRNETTLSGYLNQLDKEHLYVNAGVPGWNSTQELIRLVRQLVDYHPEQIVVVDGNNNFNIASLAEVSAGLNVPDPPANMTRLVAMGRPKGFLGELKDVVVFAGHFFRKPLSADGRMWQDFRMWLGETFPSLRQSQFQGEIKAASLTQDDRKIIDQSAQVLVGNWVKMKKIADSFGIRISFFFQPLALLHEDVKEQDLRALTQAYYSPDLHAFMLKAVFVYHDAVFRLARAAGLEVVDVGNFFDSQSVADKFVGSIFLDYVHLADLGEELLAKRVYDAIGRDRMLKEGSIGGEL